MKKLSVVIITRNEEYNIKRCIGSVKELASEILVIDSFSEDKTVEIAREEGCRVVMREFEGYGNQKQFGVEQAANDWILSLDADEVVTNELRDEIRILLETLVIQHSGYYIPFSLHYLGRLMRYSGTGKEFHLRLFDRRQGKFTLVRVHEGVEMKGSVGTLANKIIHYSYRDISHHIQKINTYTTQAAEGYVTSNRRFRKSWVAIKFPVSFFIFYFLKRGILDGYQGFLWSFFAAFYGSMKVAKTIEMKHKQQ